MQIKTPKRRAYYPASRNEPYHLLCWIPVEELERMVQDGHAPPEILDDYPDGLEVEVSTSAFSELDIDIGVSPEAIQEAYARFQTEGQLPPSGIVDGASLENEALGAFAKGVLGFEPVRSAEGMMSKSPSTLGQALPEPEMTDGEDPRTVMLGLKK